jgi:plastocyanin
MGLEEEEEEKGRDYGPGKFLTALILFVALALALSIGGVLISTGKGGATVTTGTTVILPSGVGTDRTLDYQPATITVVVGVNNTISWLDMDSIPHTVTNSTGAPVVFDKTMTQGDTFTITFSSPGTYHYFCRFHDWMKGTIIVKAAVG